MKNKHSSFSVLGNIAVINSSKNFSKKEKLEFAKEIMKKNSGIKTVLEKSGSFKGRLRKMKTKHIYGEKTQEVIYRENNCVFRFNIDETYFSPRLSNERKEISSYIKKNDEVLVMFAGVAPFSIVLAKNTQAKKIYSNELNRKANEYAKINAELNSVKNKIEFVNGDIKKVSEKLKMQKKKFDVILMPRPQLKDSFLKFAFDLSKKGTRIYYYDFCKFDEIDKIIQKIKKEAEKYKKKIKILKFKSAGELAPYKIRCRIDFKVLN